MAGRIKFRGGTTAEHSTFVGSDREITVDTTKKTLVLHDGVLACGYEMARQSNVDLKADKSNTYTKAQVDTKVSQVDAKIDTEKGRIDAILSASEADKDSFKEIVDLINSVDTANDNAFAGYVASNNAAVALKAPLNSPAFTGSPILPTGTIGVTQSVGNSSTRIATTAFVNAEIANDTYSKSQINTALGLKVDNSEIASVNLFRADKYLASQNVSNMSYDGNGKLSKVQYNNSTDVDYEVLTYNVDGKLSNVAHYTTSTLRGNTVLSYSAGKLVSAIYTGV